MGSKRRCALSTRSVGCRETRGPCRAARGPLAVRLSERLGRATARGSQSGNSGGSATRFGRASGGHRRCAAPLCQSTRGGRGTARARSTSRGRAGVARRRRPRGGASAPSGARRGNGSMRKRLCFTLLLLSSCGAPGRPVGLPPPEYEQPSVAPWPSPGAEAAKPGAADAPAPAVTPASGAGGVERAPEAPAGPSGNSGGSSATLSPGTP